MKNWNYDSVLYFSAAEVKNTYDLDKLFVHDLKKFISESVFL